MGIDSVDIKVVKSSFFKVTVSISATQVPAAEKSLLCDCHMAVD